MRPGPALGALLALPLASCLLFSTSPLRFEPYRTESGLSIQEIYVSTGTRARAGDRVRIHYTMSLEDGAKVDSSLDRDQPIAFVPGSGTVLAGLEEGVVGMAVHGRRRLVLPPELAYGDEGLANLVPPGATLAIEVELVGLEPDPDAPPAPHSW